MRKHKRAVHQKNKLEEKGKVRKKEFRGEWKKSRENIGGPRVAGDRLRPKDERNGSDVWREGGREREREWEKDKVMIQTNEKDKDREGRLRPWELPAQEKLGALPFFFLLPLLLS